jgi:hypothetical protein
MRYRALSPTGDYTFGQNLQNFLHNTPAAVAQAVKTRLGLTQGEWFLDNTAGTPWNTQILGAGTQNIYDLAIQNEILGTQGVTAILDYASNLNRSTRALTVTATINTQYGQTKVTTTL